MDGLILRSNVHDAETGRIGDNAPRYSVRAVPGAPFRRLICTATPVEFTRHRANCSLTP